MPGGCQRVLEVPVGHAGDIESRTIGTTVVVQPDIRGKQLRFTSKSAAAVGREYSQPVFGDSRLVGRFDAVYRSKQYQDLIDVQGAQQGDGRSA